MLSEKIQDALNAQVNAEQYSAQLYLSMSAYFESIDLAGAANWMRVQASEETSHAMKLFGYIAERGGRIKLSSFDAPPIEWASALEVFEAALAHERHVTSLINNLVGLARSESDYMTDNFLQWFIAEQVEEEASAEGVVNKLKLAGDGSGLFMIDSELGTRVFVDATQSKN